MRLLAIQVCLPNHLHLKWMTFKMK